MKSMLIIDTLVYVPRWIFIWYFWGKTYERFDLKTDIE